jgi:hypothetical protein
MTTREIVATFKEMYDADVSPTLISGTINIRKSAKTGAHTGKISTPSSATRQISARQSTPRMPLSR